LLPATGKELDPDDRHNLSPSGNSTPGTDVGSFARSYKQIGPVNKEVPSHGPKGPLSIQQFMERFAGVDG
jgi:hypothetical protein